MLVVGMKTSQGDIDCPDMNPSRNKEIKRNESTHQNRSGA